MSSTGSALPSLALRGYGVSFGSRVILASVDLELAADGIDVLMGPVKTGKSTLLRSLAGLNEGNALFRSWGDAQLAGRPIAEARPALVQQHAGILKGTVREALAAQLRQEAGRAPKGWQAMAETALQDFGLGALAGVLDEPLISLPLERQRAIGILSHALVQPPLLMVDEPSYGLGESAAGWLVDWLRELGRRVRLLVVLHHQQQARRLADRIVLMGGGRVLAHADTASFFQRPPNALVEQFIRTGSVAVASPDAAPDQLDGSVEAPPPLPAAAREAIASFKRGAAEAPPPPAPRVPRAEPASAAEPAAASAAQPVAAPAPAPAPAEPPRRRIATLPPPSANGVEVASTVGRVILSESRGPRGFHWIVPGRLAGCPEPGISHPIDYDLDLLKRLGITRLITLTEKDLPQDALKRHGLANLHLPVFDRESPTARQTYMLLHRMQGLMAQGHVLVVHCRAGIGRTGTVLAAWLIREGGLTAEGAIERLRAINRSYVQTEQQEAFLAEFEHDLLSRS